MRIPVVALALVACVHAGLWALGRQLTPAPGFDGTLASVSYTPPSSSRPFDNQHPVSSEQIRAALNVIAPHAHAIRTYSSTGGMKLVPAIADELGLKVTLGAWLTDETTAKDEREREKIRNRNEAEIKSAIELARKHRNVIGVVVGNETIYTGIYLDQEQIEELKNKGTYRGQKTVDDLVKLIQRVKREVQVPVTTGEIFSAWESHPALVSAVDYIAAHILPYWNKVSDRDAVDETMLRYDELRRTFPGNRVVIAEFGWPSAGYNRGDANPGGTEQAAILRDFAAQAEARGIDYNIIEAFDQPWKTNEGSVGPYWGLFNAARESKFGWMGSADDPEHWRAAGLALLLGLLLSLPILARTRVTAGETFTLAVAANT